MTDNSLGGLFPQRPSLKEPTKQDLQGIKFRGTHLHLEVYHLLNNTKKLRACTYRRMKKRQDRINKKKAKQLIPKSPQEQLIKGDKKSWLNKVQKIVQTQKLQAPPPKTVSFGNKKRKIQKNKKRFLKKNQRGRGNPIMGPPRGGMMPPHMVGMRPPPTMGIVPGTGPVGLFGNPPMGMGTMPPMGMPTMGIPPMGTMGTMGPVPPKGNIPSTKNLPIKVSTKTVQMVDQKDQK